ncbi:MAG: 50S ribosomal protein L22 [Candidatus Sulfotelmatobacter sp.]
MEFRAELRYLRVSPQKARLVLDLIKGRKVEDARNTLAYTKKRVAAHVGKLLQSALDNANFLASEKNIEVEIDNLYVKRAVANEGPRMKRIRPAPQGRAYRYQRRIAHIELVLAERGSKGEAVTHVSGAERSAPAPSKRRAPVVKAAAAGKKKVKVAAK